MEDEYTPEEETPSEYDVSYDDGRVPQRELTEFELTRGDERVSICELERQSPLGPPIRARGRVVNRGNSLKVRTAPLTEWCIEYGGNPSLWIRSNAVWYRLQRPARDYQKVHELARRRFEICARIFILCTTENARSDFSTIAQLLSCPWGEMRAYTEREILSEREFILAQISNLDDKALTQCPFVQELKSRKVSSKFKKKSGGASGAYTGPWAPRGDMDSAAETKLMKKAEKCLRDIMKHKNAFPFKKPVDPIQHGCPDYLERIAHPMDYGTIKKNIDAGKYRSAIEIVEDVRLVASNCREYNTAAHDFAVWATDFERKMESTMKAAEDAERVNFHKRVASTANGGSKKRKASASASQDDALKMARRDEMACVRDECARSATDRSKYCSDECGMAVARERIADLKKRGVDVHKFVNDRVTRLLVMARH